MDNGKLAAVLGAAVLGWALCAATMSIGMTAMPLAEVLVIRALAAPILFIFVSVFYFQRFAYTTPLLTAFIFACVVFLLDFFVMGLLNGRLGLFGYPLGTWIPLVLIFTATHITGLLVTNHPRHNVPAR